MVDQDNFKDVLELYPRVNIEAAAGRLTATQAEFRDDFAKWSHGIKELAKFDYNPLVRTPFVELANGDTVAPSPRLIMRTVTPGGLYYPGLVRYDRAFTTDLGHLLEHYVGRHLRLIDGAEVHPELSYGPAAGQEERRLVRRSARSGAHHRVQTQASSVLRPARAALPSSLNSPARWTRHTNSWGVQSSNWPPEWGSASNAYLVEKHGATLSAGHLRNVPVAAISARDLEAWVTHGAAIEDRLLGVLHDHTVGTALPIHDVRLYSDRPNSILENAWNTYPFPAFGTDEDEWTQHPSNACKRSINRPAFDAPLLIWEVHFIPNKYDPETRAKAIHSSSSIARTIRVNGPRSPRCPNGWG